MPEKKKELKGSDSAEQTENISLKMLLIWILRFMKFEIFPPE